MKSLYIRCLAACCVVVVTGVGSAGQTNQREIGGGLSEPVPLGGGQFVIFAVPSYTLEVLDDKGRLNFRRIILDATFRDEIGVAGMPKLESGELKRFAVVDEPVLAEGQKLEEYKVQLEHARDRQAIEVSELFSTSELNSIRVGSYSRYISEHGIEGLLALPKIVAELGISEKEVAEIVDRVGDITDSFAREVKEQLVIALDEMFAAGPAKMKSQTLDLVGVSDGEEYPDFLLTPLLPIRHPYRKLSEAEAFKSLTQKPAEFSMYFEAFADIKSGSSFLGADEVAAIVKLGLPDALESGGITQSDADKEIENVVGDLGSQQQFPVKGVFGGCRR